MREAEDVLPRGGLLRLERVVARVARVCAGGREASRRQRLDLWVALDD